MGHIGVDTIPKWEIWLLTFAWCGWVGKDIQSGPLFFFIHLCMYRGGQSLMCNNEDMMVVMLIIIIMINNIYLVLSIYLPFFKEFYISIFITHYFITHNSGDDYSIPQRRKCTENWTCMSKKLALLSSKVAILLLLYSWLLFSM